MVTETDKIEIRDARIEDCPFVARGICMALHSVPNERMLKEIAKICQREDVLYSYRHAVVAWDEGKPVGICLCYDGGKYHEMRKTTFPLFEKVMKDIADAEQTDQECQHAAHHKQPCDLENAEDEAVAGEYYIDSLAVMPEYRRHGIGVRLMQVQIEKAKSLGFNKATLLVDPVNKEAQGIYQRLGFAEESEVYAFGQIFWKWRVIL